MELWAQMKRFTAKIVDMVKQENRYASQGGPVILSQIENEYGNGDIESRYGPRAKPYVNWAASMVTSLDTGVPWVMCQQPDAPAPIVAAKVVINFLCVLIMGMLLLCADNDRITLAMDFIVTNSSKIRIKHPRFGLRIGLDVVARLN